MIRSETGARAALGIAIRAAQTYAADVPPSDGAGTFVVEVVVVPYGPLEPQTIRASSLAEALVRALALPFPAWFPDEDTPGQPADRNEDKR